MFVVITEVFVVITEVYVVIAEVFVVIAEVYVVIAEVFVVIGWRQCYHGGHQGRRRYCDQQTMAVQKGP